MGRTLSVADVYAQIGLPNPWPEMKVRPFDRGGWFSTQIQLMRIFEARLAIGCPIETVLEIGCWMGASTRWLADRAKLVLAIDHWQGSPEHQKGGAADCHWELPELFEKFLSNCRRFQDRIAPIRMPSNVALKLSLPPVDLAYIDGAHDANAVESDILGTWEHVKSGGILTGDDFGPSWPGVAEGLARAARKLGKPFHNDGILWMLCKP